MRRSLRPSFLPGGGSLYAASLVIGAVCACGRLGFEVGARPDAASGDHATLGDATSCGDAPSGPGNDAAPDVAPDADAPPVPTPVGVDLEVPIEILDAPRSTADERTLDQTLFTFDTDAYDGTITDSFEVIAANNATGPFSVEVIDIDTPLESRATTMIGPTGTTNVRRRFRTAFAPVAGRKTYQLRVGGQVGDQGKLYAARILVGQRGATKTKIYIPLVQFHISNSSSEVDETQSTTFVQTEPAVYSVWRKNSAAYSALASAAPWSLEVALDNSDSDGVAEAALYTTAGRQVTGSVLSHRGETASVVTKSFADSEPEFTDGTDFELRIRSSSGANTVSLLRAGLWVQLRELTMAEVYYRVLLARYDDGNRWTTGSSRILLDTGLFRSPRVSFEAVLSRDAADANPLECTLKDSGMSDEGDTGTDVEESNVSTSTSAKVRVRSSNLMITAGRRFIAGCNSERHVSSGFAVVSF